jgi:hypothetical protein
MKATRIDAYIERTTTGIDLRLGSLCATFNRPRHLLVPVVKFWFI